MKSADIKPARVDGDVEYQDVECRECGAWISMAFDRVRLRTLQETERLLFVTNLLEEIRETPCRCDPIREPND